MAKKRVKEISPVVEQQEPKPAGRPSKFKPEYIEQAAKLCEKFALTDKELADYFDVTEKTLNNWKRDYPEFLQSLKFNKDLADERIEKSLYHRAKGYSHDAVKISVNAQGMETITPFTEHYPPDTTAAIFWLKNRKPKEWRDKTDHELTGADGKDLVPEVNLEDLARRIAYVLDDSK